MVLVILAVVLLIANRFRDSGIGRSIMAVRDNENAASAYRVRPVWEKIRAFAIAGALAGMGGALLSGAYSNVAFGGPGSFFIVDISLSLVAMVVIGGMGSVTAAVIGAIWVIGIPALAPNNQVLGLLTSSIGLLAVLLYFPRGLMQVAYDARDAVLDWADRRFGKDVVPQAPKPPAKVALPEPEHRGTGVPTLAVSDLRVSFGGNVAVDGATVSVSEREIVGLIGSNGAGKSTLMNADRGLRPGIGIRAARRRGDRRRAPAYRAGLGLGRTFQSATLFPELTVTQTLLVALEGKDETGMLSTALALPPATRRSRHDRAAVGDLVDLLGLGSYRDHYIADLSTGTRRVVELAGLLALDAKVLCLDEPTAGLAHARPRPSVRSSSPYGDNSTRRCSSLSTTCRSSWASAIGCTASRPGRSLPRAHRPTYATTLGSSPATSAPTNGPSTAAVPNAEAEEVATKPETALRIEPNPA